MYTYHTEYANTNEYLLRKRVESVCEISVDSSIDVLEELSLLPPPRPAT